MGLDMAWAPHTPFSKVPLTVGVGAMTDKVIVVDGQAVIRPVLTLYATIDHRFVDGADVRCTPLRTAEWSLPPLCPRPCA
jgi:hypothetical protein